MVGKYHVIVVGGGWNGIAAVRTYLQLKPEASILLLDNGLSIGGVWSKERVYPRLYATQPSPLFEFPDWSMKDALGLEDWIDLSGDIIAKYLTLYSEKFGIDKHCRLSTQVSQINRAVDGSWLLSIQSTDGKDVVEQLSCTKLIMALGFTCIPKFPTNLDTSTFTGEIFHMKEFAARYQSLNANPAIKNVTVVGGAKSAWEAAGHLALEGKKVTWLIREGGAGPALMTRVRPDGKKHVLEGMNIRALSALAPTPYSYNTWLSRFLYGGTNRIGSWFSETFWKLIVMKDLRRLDTGKRRILKPVSDSMMWLPAGLSVSHPYGESIYDLIDEGRLLDVQRNSIHSINGKTLTLADQTTMDADAIIFATGWTHPLCTPKPLFSPEIAQDLELPIPLTMESSDHRSHWVILEREATERVHNIYPMLEKPPSNLKSSSGAVRNFSHSHHFRSLVPPGPAARKDRNIVFLSNALGSATPIHAKVSSLWAFAYLENELPTQKDAPLTELLDDRDRMERETAWEQSYFRVRYLDIFEGVIFSTFEGREMIDTLLKDLGLRHDRHGMLVGENEWFAGWKAWWREHFGNYGSAEYAGIVDEYRELLTRR